jgi:hypothetical protein
VNFQHYFPEAKAASLIAGSFWIHSSFAKMHKSVSFDMPVLLSLVRVLMMGVIYDEH